MVFSVSALRIRYANGMNNQTNNSALSAPNPTLTAAIEAAELGFSVVPVDPKTKKSIGEWTHLQTTAATPDEVAQLDNLESFAIIGGAVSGGVAADGSQLYETTLDFDAEADRFLKNWWESTGDLSNDLPIQQTGGGGYQVFFRSPLKVSNVKLAYAVNETEETGREIAIETRGEGGYSLVPPSLHPSGGRYEWMDGNLSTVPAISVAHAQSILDAGKRCCEAPYTKQQLEKQREKEEKAKPKTNTTNVNVIGAFNDAHSIEELLTQNGYQCRGERYARPGGNNPTVAILDCGSYHHSSNDPLHCEGHTQDPFAVYTYFNHDGDVRAAVKSAAVELGLNVDSTLDVMQQPHDLDPFTNPINEDDVSFEIEPKPLTVELRPVATLELEMLPLSLRDWISDVAERLSCPVDFVAIPALIGLGSLLGRITIRPKRYDSWGVIPNLWGIISARPGSKKSPAANEAIEFLERFQAEALKEYAEQMKECEIDMKIDEAMKAQAKKTLHSSAKPNVERETLKAMHFDNDSEEIVIPTLKRYLVNDTTVEALGVTLQQNPRGVFVNRDELTGWLSGLDKQGREMDKAFYLEAFNGTKRNFIYDRIGRGQLVIPHVCVSLFGTIQPGPLTQLIKASGEKSKQRDGFISRFQMLAYPDPVPYRRVDRFPNLEAKNRALNVYEFFDSITPESIGANVGGEWELPFLRFNKEGQEIFDKWLDDLEGRLASGKETTLIEEHLSKYRSLMPSLALLFHVANIADGADPGPISGHATLMAAAWCEYLESHARRIYGQSHDSDTETLERLGERLTELPNPFTLTDLIRKKWGGLTHSKDVEPLLIQLHDRGWIVGGTVQTAGRPAKKFWVNPSLIKTVEREE